MKEHRDCQEMLGQFSNYIDGELSSELCEMLESHLKGCADCTVVFNTMKKTIELYKPDDTTLSADVRQRLYKRLDISEFQK